jgi:prevent-host-death family protein
MDIILPVSEVRGKLPKLVKQIREEGRHLIITKNGRAAAVMISPEELETLEIMSDKKLLASIVRGQDDAKAGRLFTHKDIFKNV